MDKELVPNPHKFSLKPADIFHSSEGDHLNDFGIACQAIVFLQRVIKEANAEHWSPQIIKIRGDEIVSLQKEHNIPGEALPILKEQFDLAVRERYEARVQGLAPGVESGILPRQLVPA